MDKKEESHNTRRFRFKLSDEGKKVGLPIGQHVLLGADIHDSFIVRPYSPIYPVALREDDGIMELLIKIYFAGTNPHFPQGGIFSQYLESLKIGDHVKVKGPAGHVIYHGKGHFTINGRSFAGEIYLKFTLHQVNKLSMIAGGTGITPIFQLLRSVLLDPGDKTEIRVLYSNTALEDILLKSELDELSEKSRGQLKVWYTVDRKPATDWKYDIGRVNEHMLYNHLFPPSSDSVAFLCGPPAMIEHGCIPNLERIGYTEDDITCNVIMEIDTHCGYLKKVPISH